MEPRNLRWMLALALLLLFGSMPEVLACSCVGERPVCEAFGGASAVFVGRVVGSAERRTEEDRASGTKTVYAVGTIYFAVEEAFSGVKGQNSIAIHSGTGGGDCGAWFLRGKRYLIYAYADDKGLLHTNICTRTRPLEDAADDLSQLRQLPPEGTGVRLYGVVAKPYEDEAQAEEHKLEGIAGIKVTTVDSKGRRYELMTDAGGRYEVTGLKPGEYEVYAELPAYYSQEYTKRKLKVFDRGCAETSFAAIADGRISGRILDADGQPVKTAKISLFKADKTDTSSRSAEVGLDYVNDAQGKFAIAQVAPGEYILGLNLTASPTSDSPYPPTYYPGVKERSEATIIRVELGQRLDDLTLRLPPKLVERTVEGTVLWPDGSLAIGAEVYLMDVSHPGYTTTGWGNKTDAQGRFSLAGFNGIAYWVHANAPKYPDKNYHENEMTHAEPAEVVLTNNAVGIKLVLTSAGAVCEHYLKAGKQ